MGANSTQGWAVLLSLVAFTFLGLAIYAEGNFLFILLSLVALGASIGMFRKIKPLENGER